MSPTMVADYTLHLPDKAILQNPALFTDGTDGLDVKTLNITNRSQLAVMRSAVRSPEASVRMRGGCILCSRFGAAKQLCGDTEQAKLAEYPAYLHQNKKSFRKEWLFCFAGNEGREM